MVVIISPSFSMKECNENFEDMTIPIQIDKAEKILKEISKKDSNELKKLFNINDKLIELNQRRYKQIKLDGNGSPAILSYTGIVYRNICPSSFDKNDIDFCQNNVRIISGLYGILRPYDSIYEYRLDMKTDLKVGNTNNLYEYFGNSIYRNLVNENKDRIILNLCSDEYSKIITPYLTKEDKFITCFFKRKVDGKLKSVTTDIKAARGEMLNFIIKNKITDLEEVKKFNKNNYKIEGKISTNVEYIFIREQ